MSKFYSLLLLICVFLGFVFSAETLNPRKYGHVESVEHILSASIRSSRILSGSCVKTGETDCAKCLNATVANTSSSTPAMGWCSDSKFCFDASSSSNLKACSSDCNDITYSDDPDALSQCDEASISLTSIILIFILVVVCPVCLVGSCVALLCYRCHNAINNKIAVGMDYRDTNLVNTVTPVPILSVYSNAAGGRVENGGYNFPVSTAVVSVSEPVVINLDDANGFNKSGFAYNNNNNSNFNNNLSNGMVTSSNSSSSNRFRGQPYSAVPVLANNNNNNGNGVGSSGSLVGTRYDTKVDV